MGTFTRNLIFDTSTAANFISWASGVSAAFSTCGLVQGNDIGQAVWSASVIGITAASVSSGVTTYTYTLTSGPALRIGMQIAISGMTNSVNNSTTFSATNVAVTSNVATITASNTLVAGQWVTITGLTNTVLNGTWQVVSATSTSFTFSINNANITSVADSGSVALNFVITALGTGTFSVSLSGTAESGSTGTGKVGVNVCAPPLVNTSVAEIWNFADTLASTCPIGLKVQYGCLGTANQPVIFIGVFMGGTNGLGQMQGNQIFMQMVGATGGTGSTTYEWDFSYESGRINFFGWRNHSSFSIPFGFALERSRDNNGNFTGQYAFVAVATTTGTNIGTAQWTMMAQGTGGVHTFGTGNNNCQIATICNGNGTTSPFQNNVLVSPVFPIIGGFGNPCMSCLSVLNGDFPSDGSTFTVQMYGATHTFMVGLGVSSSQLRRFGLLAASAGNYGMAIRWE